MVLRWLLTVLLLSGCSGLSAPEPEGPLTGDALVEALQDGGLVLYLRHAITHSDAADGLPTDPCSKQRGLTDEGRRQARDIGAAIRALDIPIGDVRASPYCRTADTADLAFGRVQRDDALLPIPEGADGEERAEARLRAMLSEEPSEGNTVLVGHVTNLRLAVDATPEEGGAVVLRPDGDGRFLLIGEIAPGAWQRLADR